MSNVLKKIFMVVCFAFLIILSKHSITVDASGEASTLQEEILYYSDFNQYADGDDASAMWGKDNFFWVELDRAIATVKSREDGRHGIEFALTGVQHALMFGMGSGQAGLLSRVIAGETYHFSMYVDVTNFGDNHSIYFSYGEGWQIGLHLYGNGSIVVETPATISNQKYENGYLSFDFVAHQTSSYMFCNAANNVTSDDVVFFDDFQISQFVEVKEPVELVEEIFYYSDFNQYANGDNADAMWSKDMFFWCNAPGAAATVKTREDGRHGVELALTGSIHTQIFGMGSSQTGLLSKIVEGETYVFSMYIDITNLGDDHGIYFSYGEGWQIGIHLYGDGHIVNERPDNAFNPKYENGYLTFEFKAVASGSYMYCNAALNVTADDVVFFDDFKISRFVEASQHVHTVVTDAAVEVSCGNDGLTEGSHCSTCGEVLVAQEVIPAYGHTEVADAAVAATCTTSGVTAGSHCSVCNEVFVAQETVPATGHTEEVDAAVAATCTEAGKTAGSHCSVCNEVLVAQEEVEALGHTEVVDEAYDSTCTVPGKTEGSHCSVCNTVLVAQKEIPAGHAQVLDAAVEPTCTETGKTKGSHCDICGEVLVAQEEIPALGHSYNEEWKHDSEGHWHECSVCGATSDKVAHAYPVGVKDATCASCGVANGENSGASGDILGMLSGLGCAGSIVCTFFSLIALAGATIILRKKREE